MNESPDIFSGKQRFSQFLIFVVWGAYFLRGKKEKSRPEKKLKSFNISDHILSENKNDNSKNKEKAINVTGLFLVEIWKIISRWYRELKESLKVIDEKEYEYWVNNGGEKVRVVEGRGLGLMGIGTERVAEETREKLEAFRNKFAEMVEIEKRELREENRRLEEELKDYHHEESKGIESEKERGIVIIEADSNRTTMKHNITEALKRAMEEENGSGEKRDGLVTLEASKIARVMMHERRYVSKGRSYCLQVSAIYLLVAEKEAAGVKEIDFVQSMVTSIMGEKGSINELDYIWLKDGLKKAKERYGNFVFARARGNRMRNLFVLEIGGLFEMFGLVYVMISRNKVGLLYKDVEGEKELYSVEYVRDYEYDVIVYVLLVLLHYVMWEESGREQGL